MLDAAPTHPGRRHLRGDVRRAPAGLRRAPRRRELAETEWAAARGAIVEVSDRTGGPIRIPNPPWHFSDGATGVRGDPRYRGEDNRAVLTELLGYDDEAVDALEADGVLSSRVPPTTAPSSGV